MKVCLGVFAAAILWTASASGQTLTPPPPTPPVDLGTLTRPANGLPPLHLDLSNSMTKSDVPYVSRRVEAGVGPLWLLKAGAAFDAPGGIKTTVSLVGRRGYDVPLYMSETVGTNTATGFGLPSGTHAQYDAEIRLKKTLLTRAKLHVDFVGEAILPVSISRRTKGDIPDPLANTLMSSKTIRFGVVVSR